MISKSHSLVITVVYYPINAECIFLISKKNAECIWKLHPPCAAALWALQAMDLLRRSEAVGALLGPCLNSVNAKRKIFVNRLHDILNIVKK